MCSQCMKWTTSGLAECWEQLWDRAGRAVQHAQRRCGICQHVGVNELCHQRRELTMTDTEAWTSCIMAFSQVTLRWQASLFSQLSKMTISAALYPISYGDAEHVETHMRQRRTCGIQTQDGVYCHAAGTVADSILHHASDELCSSAWLHSSCATAVPQLQQCIRAGA